MPKTVTAHRLLLGTLLALGAPTITEARVPPGGMRGPGGMGGSSQGPDVLNDTVRFDARDLEFFEKRIRPVLVEQCYDCHSAESERLRARLRVDSREGLLTGGISGPAVVPGDPEGSLLIEALQWDDELLTMPPDEKLPDAVIADFEYWIGQGAADPRGVNEAVEEAPAEELDLDAGGAHWAFVPAQPADPPVLDEQTWVEGPIDAFVLASMEAHGLRPVRDADRLTLLRRVTFDLTGLPPTPDEIDDFQRDRRPDAYERVVDRLLASPAFGERWGRHWLDVARYAESSGRENNILYPHAWRYRDYVIASFNADKPYDRFLQEQLAGDLLPYDTPEERAANVVATGYLAIGAKSHNTRGRAQFAMNLVDEQIDTVTQGLMGMTVACARCHDHKFDPIPARDYYAMAGIFLSTDTRFGTTEGPANRHASDLVSLPEDSGAPPGPPLSETRRNAIDTQLERLRSQRDELADDVRRNGRRDNPSAARLRRVQQRLDILDQLVARYDEAGNPRDDSLYAMGAAEGIPRDARLLVRGELDRAADAVPRGFVSALAPEPAPIDHGSGRRELAEWIASAENPLTARVFVNRAWLHLTGRPIVATPDNFGRSGQPPTHPELLDHLALTFIEDGWSVKRLVKRIALSHTYRLGSDHDRTNAAIDPDAAYYWRMNPRRLEAEAIRDAMLAAAGLLEMTPRVGSDAATLEGPAQVLARSDARRGDSDRAMPEYRSVYLTVVRDALPESLEVFDFAEPSFVTGDRDETTVASQALYLLNDTFVIATADAMARRLLDMRADDVQRARYAFLLALGRQPSPREMVAARRFFADFPEAQGPADEPTDRRARRRRGQRAPSEAELQRAAEARMRQTGWSAFCQSLFATAEFRTID